MRQRGKQIEQTERARHRRVSKDEHRPANAQSKYVEGMGEADSGNQLSAKDQRLANQPERRTDWLEQESQQNARERYVLSVAPAGRLDAGKSKRRKVKNMDYLASSSVVQQSWE